MRNVKDLESRPEKYGDSFAHDAERKMCEAGLGEVKFQTLRLATNEELRRRESGTYEKFGLARTLGANLRHAREDALKSRAFVARFDDFACNESVLALCIERVCYDGKRNQDSFFVDRAKHREHTSPTPSMQ